MTRNFFFIDARMEKSFSQFVFDISEFLYTRACSRGIAKDIFKIICCCFRVECERNLMLKDNEIIENTLHGPGAWSNLEAEGYDNICDVSNSHPWELTLEKGQLGAASSSAYTEEKLRLCSKH